MTTRAVIYTRFSTDKQSEASTADQLRTCRKYASDHGWTVAGEYTDEGVSSGIPFEHRQGGASALSVLSRGDVLLIMHTDRLMRSEELAPLIKHLRRDGIRVIGVQEGFDSSNRQTARIQAVVTGLVGAEFRAAISDKTRSALRMRAERGYHTGGISYGYRTEPVDPGRLDGYKRLQVEETQAATVRRIFELYADGASPRNIAARLNDESVPSPGSKWKRTSRRSDGKWLATSVLSVLNNQLYTGTVRHGATYSHTLDRRDDGTRMPTAATDPVIERHEERLRIISDELWSRVKQRQTHRSRVAGARVKAGLRRRKPGGGRDGKYLLSGLLKCSVCHGSYALSNKVRYQCSSHHEGGPGACDVSLSVPRTRVENVIRGYVEDELFDPARLLEIGERYRAAASSEIVIDHGPRIAKLEQERANVVAAIKAGGLVVELGAELKELTAELARLKSERPKPLLAPRTLSAEAIERRREELLQRIKEGGPVAREVLREIFPHAIHLQPDESGKHLWALFPLDEGVARINLLYNTAEERMNAETAATLAAFAKSAELAARSPETAATLAVFTGAAETAAQVGNNGSGGPIA